MTNQGTSTMRRNLRLWLVLGVMVCVSAAIVTLIAHRVSRNPVETAAVHGPISSVDWSRAQLTLDHDPVMGCPSGQVQLQPSAESGGELAWAPGGNKANNLIIDTTSVTYGDLTGDAQPEAILNVHCGALTPADFKQAQPGGRLIAVSLTDQRLVALGYTGVPNARHLSFQVTNGNIDAQVWYEHTDQQASGFSIFAPAHMRTYQWTGSAFEQVAGRHNPLVLAPSKADRTGSPVDMPAIARPGSPPCQAGVVTFKEGTGSIGETSYHVTGNAQLVDLDGDGNQELLAQIRCTSGGDPSDSIYLFGQGPGKLVLLDVPLANNGRYNIQDDWNITDRDLTITVTDRTKGGTGTHVMRWNGAHFDGQLGDFTH